MFGDMASELARLRVEDLQREGCRLRRIRTDKAAAASASRVGCLPAEGRA
jgi:hypothetical protein